MNNPLQQKIASWKEAGYLHVAYALLFELLMIALVAFAALFTLEMLLPTFIIARLSLAKFMFLFLVLLSLLLWIGKEAGIAFTGKLSLRHPLFVLGLLWFVALLLLSLYKFPLWSIPLLIVLFLSIGYLFWQLLLGKDTPQKD